MVMTLTFCHGDFSLHPRPRQALVVYGQSSKARHVTDEQGIDFLSFPREIRNNIYSFVLLKPAFIGSETKFTKPFYKDAINVAKSGLCWILPPDLERVSQSLSSPKWVRVLLHTSFPRFLEKIGIRGRRLLQNVRWHHHKNSRPFIVLRYLRSCTALRSLKIFARVTAKDRKRFWWGIPLMNAKEFFLSRHGKIEFGKAQGFGHGADIDEEPPELRAKTAFGDFETRSLATLSENLRKVKWEVSGKYKRYDLPRISTDGMCHWKYKMIEERKERKKAERDRQREEAQSTSEASCEVQQTVAHGQQGTTDDEMIDDNDGYVVQNGNLMKDGFVVASGPEFETGTGLEDGRQTGDGTENVISSNGEDTNMVLDDPTPTAIAG